MGIVRRQGIKKTIVSLAGVLVGTISILKIYPLEFELYGRAQFILATAGLLTPFATLGFNRLTVRFFPDFKDHTSGHHGFLGFLLFLTALTFSLFVLIMIFFEEPFLSALTFFGLRPDNFLDNRNAIVVICFLMVVNSIFAMYASNFGRVVVPEIFNNLFVKFALPTLVLLFYLDSIGIVEFKHFFSLTYLVVLVCLGGYLVHLGQFSLRIDFSFIKGSRLRQMLEYGLFNALTSIGYLLSFRIDSVMIGSILSNEDVGYYNFYLYIVNTVSAPYLAIMSIVGPIIARNFKIGDLKSTAAIYRQSSETLFVVAILILGGVYISLEGLLIITGKFDVLWPLRMCFVLLAFGILLNVTIAINELIITNSPYYRFSFYSIAFLSVVNLGLNLVLIPEFGILGAAMATAFSLGTYNGIKCFYVYFRFGIRPFTTVHFKVIIIAFIVFVIVWFIPNVTNPYLNIMIHSGLFGLIMTSSLIYFKVSENISDLWVDLRKFILP